MTRWRWPTSRLGWFNFLALQWLGLRLAKVWHFIDDGIDRGPKIARLAFRLDGWLLLVGVVPLTGWGYAFVGPWKKWRIR